MATSSAGSTVVWEWHDGHSIWNPYEPHVSNFIEDNYRKRSTSGGQIPVRLKDIDPSVQAYEISFITMKQKSMIYGTERQIRRSLYPASSALAQGIQWCWRGDNPSIPWQPYSIEVSSVIEDAKARGDNSVDLSLYFPNLNYDIDLVNNEQVNKFTQFARDVQRQVKSGPTYVVDKTSNALGVALTGPSHLGSTPNVAAPLAATRPNTRHYIATINALSSGAHTGATNFGALPTAANGVNMLSTYPPITVKNVTPGSNLNLVFPTGTSANGLPVVRPASGLNLNLVSGGALAGGHMPRGTGSNLSLSGSLSSSGSSGNFPYTASGGNFPPAANGISHSGGKPKSFLGRLAGQLKSIGGAAASRLSGSKGVTRYSGGAVTKSGRKGAKGGKVGKKNKSAGAKAKSSSSSGGASAQAKEEEDEDCPFMTVINRFTKHLNDVPKDEDCSICMCGLHEEGGHDESEGETSETRKLHCGHMFHRGCLLAMLKSHANESNDSLQCPSCKKIHGIKLGNMPPGSMTVDRHTGTTVPGFTEDGYIEIVYNFDPGTQGPEHPNPGKPYRCNGFPRYCYLPDNAEGNKVLRLLEKAFDRNLTFTIGTSTTTGASDTVIWNEIHHKTELTSNHTGHGYPDENYISNVLYEMSIQGVEDSDDDEGEESDDSDL